MTFRIVDFTSADEGGDALEIWWGDIQVGELTEGGGDGVEHFVIFPRPDGQPWQFVYSEFLDAVKRLTRRHGDDWGEHDR